MHGIEEKRGRRYGYDITNGVGQVPVVDVLGINVGTICVAEKPSHPNTENAQEKIHLPSFLALLHWRSKDKKVLNDTEVFVVGEFHEGKITKRMLIFVELTDYFMEEPILNAHNKEEYPPMHTAEREK